MKPIYIRLLYILFCAASTICSANELHDIQHEVLTTHNKLRAIHQAPPLKWDDSLRIYAEHHARTCHFAHSATPYGENLAAGYPSVAAAINAWYIENAQYSYKHSEYTHDTGHFTQLVWASSKKVGCGYVTCNGENGTPGKYLVCEYSPAGNVTNNGYFKRNVLPPV